MCDHSRGVWYVLLSCSLEGLYHFRVPPVGSDLPRAGYSLWWEKDALFLPFTQRGLFDFLFALGTEGKSSVIEQEGRERRQRKRVTNVGILFRFPEAEMSFPLVGGGKRRPLQSLGLTFTVFLWLRAVSPRRCPLKPGACLLLGNSVVCQEYTNPQVKSAVSFWKSNLLNNIGGRSFEFLCFAKFLART